MAAVSILMPCYNAVDTVDEALDSLARQTLTDFEVVMVDDGSQDGTHQVLSHWAAQDARFRLDEQPHLGIVEALNTGLRTCRAEFVARMDTDDRSMPERLQRQLDFMMTNPDIVLVSCQVAGFSGGIIREGYCLYLSWINSLLTDTEIRREIFVESPFVHPSVMFRRAAVLAAGGYQELGWPEDYDLWLRLYLAGEKFAKLPETLLEWRDGPERLTRVDHRYALENFLRAKAYYLMRGPLVDREQILIWGAGMMGRRLGKQLEQHGARLACYFDIDPKKIGRTRRGRPILPPEALPAYWRTCTRPALLAAVGARNARPLIRARLQALGLTEGREWWFAA